MELHLTSRKLSNDVRLEVDIIFINNDRVVSLVDDYELRPFYVIKAPTAYLLVQTVAEESEQQLIVTRTDLVI